MTMSGTRTAPKAAVQRGKRDRQTHSWMVSARSKAAQQSRRRALHMRIVVDDEEPGEITGTAMTTR